MPGLLRGMIAHGTILVALALALATAAWAADDGGNSDARTDTFPALPLPPPIERLIGLPNPLPKGRTTYLPLLSREAESRGVPPALADAVAQVESGYDPSAVGKVGEVGLMQVRPTTAAMLGFKGPWTGLLEPETNIRYGVMYLAEAWRLTKGDLCRALMKYRAGHGEQRMTPLSVAYCRRAREHLAALGSALANVDLPQVSVGTTPPGARGAVVSARQAQNAAEAERVRRQRALMQELWAAHAARVRAIEAKVDRIMKGS